MRGLFDPDPLRDTDSADHVLGWGGGVLRHHVQVSNDNDNDNDNDDDDDCRGVNLSLRVLQDVFHVDRGIDW